jgi:hypothetical protein
VGGGDEGREVVVQASAQIRISDAEEVLDRIREYSQVADVWTV